MHSDPLTLVRAAIEAVNRADWHAAAQLCDPVSLSEFRRELLEQFEPAIPRFKLTLEEYMRLEPGIPLEVAEYHVAQHRAHTDPAQRLREELPSVPDLASLKALSPDATFAAWLDGRGPHRQIERLVAEGRISPAAAAHSAEIAVRAYPYEVVGMVPDGDRLAHVLYQWGADPRSPDDEDAERLTQRPPDEQELARDLAGRAHPQVVTCRRQSDGGWLMLAGYFFLGLGNTSISVGENQERSTAASDEDA